MKVQLYRSNTVKNMETMFWIRARFLNTISGIICKLFDYQVWWFCRFHRQFARSWEVSKKLIVQRFSISMNICRLHISAGTQSHRYLVPNLILLLHLWTSDNLGRLANPRTPSSVTDCEGPSDWPACFAPMTSVWATWLQTWGSPVGSTV